MFNRLPDMTIYRSPRHNAILVTPGLLQQLRSVTTRSEAVVTDPNCRRRDRVTNPLFASAKTTSALNYSPFHVLDRATANRRFTQTDLKAVYAACIDRYEYLDAVLRSIPSPHARALAEAEKAEVEAAIKEIFAATPGGHHG